MVKSNDMEKIIATPITEAEFTVDNYNLFDFMTTVGRNLIDIKNIFYDKNKNNEDLDLDQEDKNKFDVLYNKYSKLDEKQRESVFENFKNELKSLILDKLENLKKKHLKVLENTKLNFTDENIKKYIVHKMYKIGEK